SEVRGPSRRRNEAPSRGLLRRRNRCRPKRSDDRPLARRRRTSPRRRDARSARAQGESRQGPSRADAGGCRAARRRATATPRALAGLTRHGKPGRWWVTSLDGSRRPAPCCRKGGTFMIVVRSAPLLLLLSLAIGTIPASAVDVPGGGPAKSDCYVGFEVDATPAPPVRGAKVTGKACGSACAFKVKACINETAVVSGCTAPNVTRVTIVPPAVGLQPPPTPGSTQACGPEASVEGQGSQQAREEEAQDGCDG